MRPLFRRSLAALTGLLLSVSLPAGAGAATPGAGATPTDAFSNDVPVQFPTRYTLVDLGLCTGTDCGVVTSTGAGDVLYMGGRAAWAVAKGGVGSPLGWSLDTITGVPSNLHLGAKAVVTGTVGSGSAAPCARWVNPAVPEHVFPGPARACAGVPSRADDAGTVIVQRTASSAQESARHEPWAPRPAQQPLGLTRVSAGQSMELTVAASGPLTLSPLTSSETGVHLATATVVGEASQYLLRVDPTGSTSLLPCPRPADPTATTAVTCAPVAISPDGAAQLVRATAGPELGWFWAYPDGTFSLAALPLEDSLSVLGINNRGDVLAQRGDRYTVFHKVTCAYCMRSVTLNASSVPAWPANGFHPVAIDNDARILGTASSQPGMNTIARLLPAG